MYAALWRLLPGPRWLRATQATLLVLAVVLLLFLVVFPAVEPALPFDEITLEAP